MDLRILFGPSTRRSLIGLLVRPLCSELPHFAVAYSCRPLLRIRSDQSLSPHTPGSVLEGVCRTKRVLSAQFRQALSSLPQPSSSRNSLHTPTTAISYDNSQDCLLTARVPGQTMRMSVLYFHSARMIQ